MGIDFFFFFFKLEHLHIIRHILEKNVCKPNEIIKFMLVIMLLLTVYSKCWCLQVEEETANEYNNQTSSKGSFQMKPN